MENLNKILISVSFVNFLFSSYLFLKSNDLIVLIAAISNLATFFYFNSKNKQ